MESKKNIGKLFRDNLDQMDFSPSEKVWDRIEIGLEKKKKKRRFLFWLFFTVITTSMLTSGRQNPKCTAGWVVSLVLFQNGMKT